MNRIIKCIALGLVALFSVIYLRAATHVSPSNEESILHASDVYLLHSRQEAGLVHFYIEAIWRHDPKAGAAPALGSEFAGPMARESTIIMFIFNPRLRRTGRQDVPVIKGDVPRFQMSVDELRATIQSTAWVPSPSNP